MWICQEYGRSKMELAASKKRLPQRGTWEYCPMFLPDILAFAFAFLQHFLLKYKITVIKNNITIVIRSGVTRTQTVLK